VVKARRFGNGAIWHGTSRAPRRRCAETDLPNAGSLAKKSVHLEIAATTGAKGARMRHWQRDAGEEPVPPAAS
jgi:hypothetical protein